MICYQQNLEHKQTHYITHWLCVQDLLFEEMLYDEFYWARHMLTVPLFYGNYWTWSCSSITVAGFLKMKCCNVWRGLTNTVSCWYRLVLCGVYRALYLRSDEITDGKCRDQLLSIAKKTIEEYYVAPPGERNIFYWWPLLFLFLFISPLFLELLQVRPGVHRWNLAVVWAQPIETECPSCHVTNIINALNVDPKPNYEAPHRLA